MRRDEFSLPSVKLEVTLLKKVNDIPAGDGNVANRFLQCSSLPNHRYGESATLHIIDTQCATLLSLIHRAATSRITDSGESIFYYEDLSKLEAKIKKALAIV
jgi:hypothetical protein